MFKGFRNKGDKYESLIQYVYQQLSWANDREIEVKRNQKLKGKSGNEHQIDVYYEFEQNGIKHKVIIECKNHKRKVDKGMVQSFKSVLDDIGNATGVFASYKGFQSGAERFAQYHDIELVSGSELPMLAKTISKSLEVLLPDKNVVGQPFWTIMEEIDGRNTGTYLTITENTIGLFISKKNAVEVSNYTGGVVRGVSQKHLRMILKYVKLDRMKVGVNLINPTEFIGMPLSDIEKHFMV